MITIIGNKSLAIMMFYMSQCSYRPFSRSTNCSHTKLIIAMVILKDTLSPWYVPYYCMIYDSNTFTELVIYNNLFIQGLH